MRSHMREKRQHTQPYALLQERHIDRYTPIRASRNILTMAPAALHSGTGLGAGWQDAVQNHI